jgi:hypothetical protein
MATSELPFTGRTTAAVLLAVVNHEPKRHESANLPPALANLISRLLTKEREGEGRPATAAAIAEELREIEYGLAAIQIVPLDSVPNAAAIANPFADIETTQADEEQSPRPARQKKPISKAWILGGIAAMLAVAASAGLMFKLMTKGEAPVAKNDELPPKPKPKEPPVAGPRSPDLVAAETLLSHGYYLNIRMSDGKKLVAKPGEALPVSPFLVVDISAPKSRLPDGFVHDVLIPAVSNLTALESVADSWFFTHWSEADVVALAKSPCAARLVGLRGGIPLTPATIATLRVFPKLDAISVVVGPDTAWSDFAQLPKVAWIQLRGDGTTTVAAAAWKVLVERTFAAVELERIMVDDATASALASIPLRRDALFTFNDCPGATSRFAVIAKNPDLRVLTFGDTTAVDADLAALEAFKQVKSIVLWLYPPKVKQAAVESLSKKLPECEIVYLDRSFGPSKK